MEILHLGLDMGKNYSHYYGFTESGFSETDKIPTIKLGAWHLLLAHFAERYEVHVCFEACVYYEWLYDLLSEYATEVVMVDPAQFAIIAKSHKKTDKLDAQRLAEGLFRGDLPDVYVPAASVRSDRRLSHFAHFLSQERGQLKVRIRCLLETYRLRCAFKDIFGKQSQAWLVEEAKPKMDEQGQLFLEMLLDLLSRVVEHEAKIRTRIEKRLDGYGHQAKIAQSIPGFGALTALAVLASIGEIRRFDNPKKLSSYFGVCGRVYQSGKTLRNGSITKRGDRTVRWLLSQSISGLHRKDPWARQRYQRLKRKKPTGVARSAQVRWLSKILWLLLTKEETYEIRKRPANACKVA